MHLFVLVCMIAAFPLSVAIAETRPRSVLLLDQSEPSAPWGNALRPALQSALNEGSKEPIIQYVEVLDLGRFNRAGYTNFLRDYLREKYRDKTIDVIVTHGAAALAIALQLRPALWPEVPIVFAVVPDHAISRALVPSNVTGTLMRLSLEDSIAVARALVPNLKRVFHVGDPLEQQTFFRHLAEEFAALSKKMEFIDLAGMPLSDLQERVSRLPPDSAIIFTAIYLDRADFRYTSMDALTALAEAANRPIIGLSEVQIGRGATGGVVAQPAIVAENAATTVLRILDGESASRIPIAVDNLSRPVFDWRRLTQFDVDESKLPPGSEIRFRQNTLWEEYHWQIVAIFAVVLLQFAFISWLLFERRRRRVAELEARRRLLEVTQLNRAANLGGLSASIAHELNQPLGAILSNTEAAELLLAQDDPNVHLLREILADIRRDDLRAGEIIKRLRGLLRRTELHLHRVDLQEVIDDVLRIVHAEAIKDQVVVNAFRGPDVLYVLADHVHLQQVLLNLATNALDAVRSCAPARRRITFDTALIEESKVEVSVADSGVGIPAGQLNSLFEVFYTTKPQGTGLGLSIARTIVETYGGKIWAENRADGGAVFRFTLPLAGAQPT